MLTVTHPKRTNNFKKLGNNFMSYKEKLQNIATICHEDTPLNAKSNPINHCNLCLSGDSTRKYYQSLKKKKKKNKNQNN